MCFLRKKKLDLRINTTTLHNIRESGFKIGADTAATEALDVAGNILASGSINSSSAIINGVNIGSGLTSLETQVRGKQNTLTSSNNIKYRKWFDFIRNTSRWKTKYINFKQ